MRGDRKFERGDTDRKKHSVDQSYVIQRAGLGVEGGEGNREGSLGRKEKPLHLEGGEPVEELSTGQGTKIQRDGDRRMSIEERGKKVEEEEKARSDPQHMLIESTGEGVRS